MHRPIVLAESIFISQLNKKKGLRGIPEAFSCIRQTASLSKTYLEY